MVKIYCKIKIDKLHTNALRLHFKGKSVFENRDIIDFYKQTEKGVKPTTVNWRVYNLVQLGVIQRIGRAKFTLGEAKNYIPEISSSTKSIFRKLKKAFPFANLCVWNTSVLNEFMQHQPNQFFVLVEADKETIHSIFYFLRDSDTHRNKMSVFLEPTKDMYEKYIVNEKEVIILKPLTSEAPTQNINGIITPTIEKMLVDVFCDEVVFSAQQGSEMRTIFKEAFGKYTINQSKMLRYADRRRKQKELIPFVKTISDLWQQ